MTAATPWWRTSLIITGIVVALAAVAVLTQWPWNGLAGLGAAVFFWLALRNPEHWLRRLAQTCVLGAIASSMVPEVVGWLALEDVGQVVFQTSDALAYALLGSGVLLAALEVWRERGKRDGDAKDDGVAWQSKPERAAITPEELATYRLAACVRHGTTDFLGLSDRSLQLRAAWEDLYVELVMEGGPVRDGRETYFDHDASSQPDLRRAFDFARGRGMKMIALLGHPGSGKTTQLQQILLHVLGRGGGPKTLGLPADALAVLVPLRNVRLPTDGTTPSLIELLSHALVEDLRSLSPELAKRLITSSRTILLLDGLDEIADTNDRTAVARLIADAQGHAPPWSMSIVSCRFAGFEPVRAVLDRLFVELRIRLLDSRQVKRLVKRWYRLIEVTDVASPPRWHPSRWLAWWRGRRRATNLLQQLNAPGFRTERNLLELSRTPLFLTALCIIHRYRAQGRELPTDKEQIYAECEMILLERWRKDAKQLSPSFEAGLARRVLEAVAHWLHDEDGRRHAPARALVPAVEQGLTAAKHEHAVIDDVTPERFLGSFTTESGLLTKHGPDLYGFIHLAFQEHLTALYLRAQWQGDPAVLERVASRFEVAWWKEVILLMLRPGDVAIFDAFMRQVVRQPAFAQWAQGEAMQLLLSQRTGASMRPFVEVLEQRDGEALAPRQLAAARVLVERMHRERDEAVVKLLETHPAREVRAWWAERRGRAGVEVITATRGGVELVRIEGGTFWMGSEEDDPQAFDGERPRHSVTLKTFYLARTPVTNAQYREFLQANPGVREPRLWGDRQHNQDDQPVVGVSWHEAKAYCAWAELVLPTEAQWEYACRAGTTTQYWSGDREEDLARVGWYGGNSEMRLHAVAEKDANPWGLHDMHGNVWEWCSDEAFASYATSVHADDGLRKEPVGDALRVMRGGSWRNDARFARAAYRIGGRPDYRDQSLGFRPALRPREVVESSG